MKKSVNVPAAPQRWKRLVEAAIFETNTDDLSRRIQDAQDAIRNQIEASFQTASESERQSLLNAMNSLWELRRLAKMPASEIAANVRNMNVRNVA
jgi:hypothetical protein